MAAITAANIMARSEATLSPDLNIYRASQQLLKSKLTGAPVVDDNGVRAMDGLPGGNVSDYMSAPAESIRPTARLYDIVHLFLTRAYRKLPVVDDEGRVIGQVSRHDTLKVLESIRGDPRLHGTLESP